MTTSFGAGDLTYRVTHRSILSTPVGVDLVYTDYGSFMMLPVSQGYTRLFSDTPNGTSTLTAYFNTPSGIVAVSENSVDCRRTIFSSRVLFEFDDVSVSPGTFSALSIELTIDAGAIDTTDNLCNVRVSVFEPDGTTLITHVNRRRDVRWTDELNAPGVGQITFYATDPLISPDVTLADPNQFVKPVLQGGNIVKIYVAGAPVKAWVMEEFNEIVLGSGEEAERAFQVSGRGIISLLDQAVIYPEYGLKASSSEDRIFNFSSADGVWRDVDEWEVPQGLPWTTDTTYRKGLPAGWPDPDAQWLWDNSPNSYITPLGPAWFRTTFTLTQPTSVVVYATADNAFIAYMDGIPVMSSGGGNVYSWFTRFEWRGVLQPGTHVFGAAVFNTSVPEEMSTTSPAGFIATAYKTDALANQTGVNVFRTHPDNTIVKGGGTTPGWRGSSILQQLVIEAQQRGNVRGIFPIRFGYGVNQDSALQPWDDVQERIFKVGTTDLLDLAVQLSELSFDFDLSPDFILKAWKQRGSDLSDTITLSNTSTLTSFAQKYVESKVKNHALVKFEGGWLEIDSPVSGEIFGRREVGLSLGNSTSVAQTQLEAEMAIRELHNPDTDISLQTSCVMGPQPYRDFNIGDYVRVHNDSYIGINRCASITGSEDTNGIITWDYTFYDEDLVPLAVEVVTITGGDVVPDTSGLYQSQVLSDSPWGFWRLAETGVPLKDSSGNKRDFTSVSASALNAGGPISRAVTFTGTQSLSTTATFKQSIATVEAWVFITAYPTTSRSAVIAMATAAGSSIQDKNLGIDTTGKLYFRVVQGGTTSILTSTFTVPLNTWVHLAGSVGPAGQKMYYNGELVGFDGRITRGNPLDAMKVFVKGGGASHNAGMNCSVAEPAVYFQQLLDSRIESHWLASGLAV